jgi:hypothetical protein
MIIRAYQNLPIIGKLQLNTLYRIDTIFLRNITCSKYLDFNYGHIEIFYLVLKKGKLQGDSSFCFTVCAACSMPCLSLSSDWLPVKKLTIFPVFGN